jgi:hypothetical protein
LTALVSRPPVGGRGAYPAFPLDQREDAGNAQRRRLVRANDPAASDRPLSHRREDHAAQPDITREKGRAVDFGREIEPGQRLADQAIARAAPHQQGFGQVRRRGRLRKLGKGDPLPAPHDEPGSGVERLPVDVPAPGGSLHQERPGGGAGFAEARLEGADGGRAAGHHALGRRCGGAEPPIIREQIVGVEGPERRRLHSHRPPIRPELVRQDLRQAGIDALPHLGLRHRHDHAPVAPDLQECVEQGLPRRGGKVRLVAPRPQRIGDDQAHARAAADQQLATGDARTGG